MIGTLEQAWSQRNRDRAAVRATAEALLADAHTDRRTAALARVVLCYLDYRERRYEQAATAGFAALAVLEVDPADPWLPRLYNNLAIIHYDLGERDASCAYLDRQIRLSQQLGDHSCEAIGYHDLGLLQAAVDPRHGLATLAHARTLFHAHGDDENEALVLYNMANIHQHAAEGEQAAAYAHQALQLLHTRGIDGFGFYLAVHLWTLTAEIATTRGRYDEARGLLDEARNLATSRLPELLPHVCFCQGLYLVAAGDDQGAAAQFEDALAQLGSAGSYDLLADCHTALADCKERLGEYRAALAHQRAYSSLRERVFKESGEQKVRAIEVIHRTEIVRRAAEAERQRNIELQRYIHELEQLQARLRALTLRDPLTGLYNRRYLTEEGARLLAYARRHQTGFCAAMIDVDRFKQINDTMGHSIGDLVLQQLADILRQGVRSSDLIARYGGEELALLLPSTGPNDAFNVCERLRTLVELYDWSAIQHGLRVTVSIGLAEDTGGTLAKLLDSADIQLYAAKGAGRNRTNCG